MELKPEVVRKKSMREGTAKYNEMKRSEKAAKRLKEKMADHEYKLDNYLDDEHPDNGGSQYVPNGSGSHRRRMRIKLIVNQLKSRKMGERKIRAGLLIDFTERKTDEYMRTAKEIIKTGV